MKYTSLLRFVTPRRHVLLLIFLLLMLGSAISLSNPWIAGMLTEALLQEKARDSLGLKTVLLLWLGIIAARSMISFLSQYYISITGEKILVTLRTRIYEHLQILPMRYFHEHSPGETLALLSNEASIISRFVTGTLIQLLCTLLVLITPHPFRLLPLVLLMNSFSRDATDPRDSHRLSLGARTALLAFPFSLLIHVAGIFPIEDFLSEPASYLISLLAGHVIHWHFGIAGGSVWGLFVLSILAGTPQSRWHRALIHFLLITGIFILFAGLHARMLSSFARSVSPFLPMVLFLTPTTRLTIFHENRAFGVT